MGSDKIYQMEFSKIYGLLVNKAMKKGRTKEEFDEVIRWLTGYSQTELEGMPGMQCLPLWYALHTEGRF